MYPESRALLVVGETSHSADPYHVVRYLFHDPVVFLDKGDGDTLLACTDFERQSASGNARARRVHGFSDYDADDLATKPDHEHLAAVTLRVLRAEGVRAIVVTNDIPLFVADHLRANGVDVVCQPDLLTGSREVKDGSALVAIESAQRATERATAAAVDVVATATVDAHGVLYDGEAVVTSERLRAVIDASLLEDNCVSDGTITASGAATAEPHNRGQGPIHAGQPIILDIFPRHKEHRYYADMTRTISKGQPADEISQMYGVTRDALDLALGLIRPGVTGKSVYDAVCRYYEDHGYATYLRTGHYPEAGLIHSLGHGVGLEIHEAPSLGRRENVLQEGQVITVEPGLYVPGLGGVRVEDMVTVTADGCRNLTRFPRTLVV